jgi:hypothetical protein
MAIVITGIETRVFGDIAHYDSHQFAIVQNCGSRVTDCVRA